MRRVTDDGRRTDDDARCKRPLLVWPAYTVCRRASNNQLWLRDTTPRKVRDIRHWSWHLYGMTKHWSTA